MSSKDDWSQWLLDSQIRGELGISEYFFQISLNVSIFAANFAWQFFHLVRLARIDRLTAVFNIVVRKRLIAIMPYPSRTHLKKSKWLHVFQKSFMCLAWGRPEYLGYNECGQFLLDRANKLKRRVGYNMTLYEKGKSLFLKLNESVLEPT